MNKNEYINSSAKLNDEMLLIHFRKWFFKLQFQNRICYYTKSNSLRKEMKLVEFK